MAVSHVLRIEKGNEVRSAMSLIDLDGGVAVAENDTIGITVQTIDAAGADVTPATAELFTVPAGGLSNRAFVAALANQIDGSEGVSGIAGCRCTFAENSFDKFVLHVEAESSPDYPAIAVVISLPVLTVA